MSDCALGNIVTPTNNQILQTDMYPFAIPFQVASVTPIFNFITEISLDNNFSTADGYISADFNGNYFINVTVAGTYYIRLSCDGVTWTPVVKFKVVTLSSNAFSSITNFSVKVNSESTGFDVLIPQLLYGPPTSGVIGRIYYVQTLEINITTDPTFRTNIQRFYMYGNKIGDLYKSNCPVIGFNLNSSSETLSSEVNITSGSASSGMDSSNPCLSSQINNNALNSISSNKNNSVYYFRVRLMVNNVWEPYSTVNVSWSN